MRSSAAIADAGEDCRRSRPPALAVFTLTTMEGGVMQSRTQRTLASLRSIRRDVARLRRAAGKDANFKPGRGNHEGKLCVRGSLRCVSVDAQFAADGHHDQRHVLRDADGHRVQQLSVVVDAPVSEGLGRVHHR
jgi:hypothetical protein